MIGLIILSMLLIFALEMYWSTWLDTCGNYPRIKFKDFKKFYALNPERWNVLDEHVGCKTSSGKYEYFRFGFIDFGRYIMWQVKIAQGHTTQAHMEVTQRMMNAVKEDIDAAKAKENINQSAAFKILEDLRKMNMTDECPSLVELLKKYGIDDCE